MKNNNNKLNLNELAIFNSENKCTNAFAIASSVECLKAAYWDLKSKPGMMTKGIDDITLDGITEKWFTETSEKLRREQYRFKPARRVYIPKANGKTRPLGIASPRDRIVQQAFKLIMESVIEPRFSNLSHGFRPNRGCHTALKEVRTWKGVSWFIEGDISKFFDNIDHKILETMLEKHFKDARLIHLYWKLVKAGYVEWNSHTFQNSIVGVPQGGIISPLLSNLILNELDEYMEKRIAEQESLNAGILPYIRNPYYHKLESRIRRMKQSLLTHLCTKGTKGAKKGDKGELKNTRRLLELIKERRRVSSAIPNPKFSTRIKYVRYADDWIVGIWGPKAAALQLKGDIKELLTGLKLELSIEKTLITNARTERAKFLGTYITKLWVRGTLLTKARNGNSRSKSRRRVPGGNIWMTAPILDIMNKLKSQGFCYVGLKNELRAKAISKFVVLPLREIVIRYRSIYLGFLNYYSFVDNIGMFRKIHWILMGSLKATIRRKCKLSWKEVNTKWGKNITILEKKKRPVDFCFERPERKPMNFKVAEKLEFIDPLLAKIKDVSTRSIIGESCANCGAESNIEMHHLKHIRALNTKLNTFDKMLAKINRKQVPLCKNCHVLVHSGKHDGISLKNLTKAKGLY